jgi:hypothetical protein
LPPKEPVGIVVALSLSEKRRMEMNAKRDEQSIGSIETSIAGTQYTEARALPEEPVYLERDADNRHDSNAIRVQNMNL